MLIQSRWNNLVAEKWFTHFTLENLTALALYPFKENEKVVTFDNYYSFLVIDLLAVTSDV